MHVNRESLIQEYPLPLDLFYRWEAQAPERIFLRQPHHGTWKTYTYAQAGQEIRRMAAMLQALKLAPGSKVAILSKNCAHWMMADLAIWMAGHVSVPLYASLNAQSLRQIIEHSESKAVFVGKLDDYKGLAQTIPENVPAFYFPYDIPGTPEPWDALLARHAPVTGEPKRGPLDLATLIYTSGTTGKPKGVMHDFLSMAIVAKNLQQSHELYEGARFFSYLPLAHVGERALIEMGCLATGGTISFAESLETFAKNLQESAPHVILAVPRILTRFQMGVLEKLPQKKLSRLLRIPGIAAFVRRKLQTKLGLRDAYCIMTGAAPVPASLLKWYQDIGLEIREAYAMTENMAYSHSNYPRRLRFGSGGQPMKHVEAKIAAQNELWVATPANMLGYYKDPEQTRAALEGEYLKTGDQAEIDGEGYVKITGRVKDMFKTSKGKYVVPVPIEMELSRFPGVQQVCVVGSALPQPMALLVLQGAWECPDLQAQIKSHLSVLNKSLESHERLAKCVVVKEPWTIENNLLTPTLKIKRNAIEEKYGQRFETWYSHGETVLWEMV